MTNNKQANFMKKSKYKVKLFTFKAPQYKKVTRKPEYTRPP